MTLNNEIISKKGSRLTLSATEKEEVGSAEKLIVIPISRPSEIAEGEGRR